MQAALTIAGSDPSGGAGIQADLKTFHQARVYGEAVITLVTVQNTRSVTRVEVLPPDLVAQQIAAVLEDIPPAAIKTGALGSAEVMEAVADALAGVSVPVVVDPVMISKHGAPLMDEAAREVLVRRIFPLATVVTPNVHEAEVLTGVTIRTFEDAKAATYKLIEMGCRSALVKGGHLDGAAIDVLVTSGQLHEYRGERIETPHTHGTGCTYSAKITAQLAKGEALINAVRNGKTFISAAIRTSPGLGSGNGPVNHFVSI
jgi:hydroxymethylpyrimidine/phosphomethylpyrimidine kinase